MVIRRIQESELMEARNISSVCFTWSHDTKGKTQEEYLRELREQPPSKADAHYLDTWAAFTEDKEMMAALSVVPYQIYFDGQKVPMAGIGGVCTYPQFRRHGGIRGIFTEILPQMQEDKILFSYLYPFSESFYRKFGYERSGQSKRWTLDLKSLPNYDDQDNVMPGKLKLCRSKEEQEFVKASYEAFACRHNLCVSRDEYDWGVFKNTDPFTYIRFLYYYERPAMETSDGVQNRQVSGDRECGGYFVFEVKEENGRQIMECPEFIFRDMSALRALLALARTFQGSYDDIRFWMPDTVNLDHFVADYAKSGSRSDCVRHSGMVRVICVKEVLKLARYQGSGSLAIQVTDPLLDRNNRIFKVRYADGRAVSVESFPVMEALQPDVVMPVNLFSSAIVGSLSVSDMEYRPEIEWHCDPAKAAGVFFKKSNWINNFF